MVHWNGKIYTIFPLVDCCHDPGELSRWEVLGQQSQKQVHLTHLKWSSLKVPVHKSVVLWANLNHFFPNYAKSNHYLPRKNYPDGSPHCKMKKKKVSKGQCTVYETRCGQQRHYNHFLIWKSSHGSKIMQVSLSVATLDLAEQSWKKKLEYFHVLTNYRNFHYTAATS